MVNNLGLGLGMALTFYTRVAKGLKLKVRRFLRLIPTFVEVTGEKLLGEPFWPPTPFWIGLKCEIDNDKEKQNRKLKPSAFIVVDV